jgi:hypothetical protein
MSKDFSLMEDSNRSSNLSIHDVQTPHGVKSCVVVWVHWPAAY